MTVANDIRYFARADGVRLAYRFVPGSGPLLLFLPGYMSDMEGGKAQAVLAYAKAQGQACLLVDYSGCGSSEGAFEDGTLTLWRDDVLAMVAHLWRDGRVLPIGSSMGGWLALLVALALKDRIAGLVGVAAAPDFTEWGFGEERRAILRRDGKIVEPGDYDSDYITTMGFWQSGQDNLLLGGSIDLDCPVRLFHGQADEVVPWQIAPRVAEALRSSDVQMLLVKDGDHRLSRDQDIAQLLGLIEGLLESL